MNSITTINYIIAVLFAACYLYQLFYAIFSLIKKNKKLPDAPFHRYAVLISARNEESVIGQLIQSIKNQKYPSNMLDIYVVADNCTDATALKACKAGAMVYERFNENEVGKGYALQYLFSKIDADRGYEYYDAYFIFDADNLLDENYIAEMNKTFSQGYRIVTSYRNSKNYGDNWISAGYALWFLREAKTLNNARMLLGNCCAVSGTGYMLDSKIVRANNGWPYHLLTEDIELTIDQLTKGETIGYCANAVFYDEQPVKFKESWNQRMRWAKGYLQVFCKYKAKLIKGIFSKRIASHFDMMMTILPAIVLTIFSGLVNTGAAVYGLISGTTDWNVLFLSAGQNILNAYLMLLFFGTLTLISEWNEIHCANYKKILYLLTFPLFMFTYIPISFVALFCKVQWTPIHHSVAVNLNQVLLDSRRRAA